jgi:hypothetical protein
MKTRYLTLFLTAAGAVFAVGGCSTDTSNLDPNVEARLRNTLPSACTAEQIKACPAVDVTRCPGGEEPVIDYSSDCCPHFTCQPLCSSPQQSTCPMTPAPACPAGTKLWIGTAVEDCCPAYRCQPDGTTCDPTRHDATACTLALPYCGPNVMPVVVGETPDCCPVYQCPCSTVKDPTTGLATSSPACGCTTPSCMPGQEVVCFGKDACGGPCECQTAHGNCMTDADCSSDARCDVSSCRLPPVAGTNMVPTCDPAKCGPALGIATIVCSDGINKAGPTGRCLLNADGNCSWEVTSCPNDGCYGACVPNIQTGCKTDTDCPTGQACDVTCSGWGCGPTMGGGTSTGGTNMPVPDPSTGMSVPPTPACACPTSDPSCVCDANGNCKGQTCSGQCVPAKTTCDPNKPVACPTFAPVCPDGATPISVGVDPMSCCPTYKCPTCVPAATTNGTMSGGTACPAVRCPCAKIVSTDPATCCPKYECGLVNADGTCA